MKAFLREALEAVEAAGLRRALHPLTSPQGREIVIDGAKVLNFCSNDYLALAGDPRLAEAAAGAAQGYGFGAGAARLVCGNAGEHEALERELAQAKHTEAALLFNCGYMANTGIIPSLVGRGDAIFADKLNHASLVDGAVLSRADFYRYPHGRMDVLEAMLKKTGDVRRKLIVTDTVFSMDGDVAPLAELVVLARKYEAWLMVDEAHAFGVLGPTGGGLVEATGTGDRVAVQMGTLSKAAGSYGAYVAGSRDLRDFLINTARSFIYTTGLPPAVSAASRMALKLMAHEPWRRTVLLENARKMRTALQGAGFDTLASSTPIIPVMVGDACRAKDISCKLLLRGIFAAAIRPPTVPVATARLRITVTAAHTDADIARCVEALKDVS